MKSGKSATPLRTALTYAIFGVLWILLSDTALSLLVPATSPSYTVIQSFKGWLFVCASAVLIYLMLRSDMKSLQERQKHINYQAGLIEDISDAIISTDMQFRILSWNTAAERMYGWTASEVTGQVMRKFVQIEYLDTSREEAIKTALEQGKWRGEVSQNHKNGRRFFVSSTISLVKDQDGQAIGFVAINRDITERKQAEDALHDSQMQLEGIFNSTMDAIITVDEEQKIIIFNPAAEQMFRSPASEVIGQTLDRFLPDYVRKDHKEYLRAFGKSNSTKRSMNTPSLVLICLRADGEEFPSEISISQIELGGRKLYTAIVRDITDRKQVEDELKASEEKYRDLVENSNDLICTHDLNGNLLSVNEAAVRLTGYSRASLLQMNLRGAFAPDGESRLDVYLKYIKAHGQAQGTMRVRIASGEFRIWEYNNTLRTDGMTDPIVRGSARDITERKRAEDALRESQQNYASLVDTIDGIVWEADAQTFQFSFVSKKSERLLGYPTENWVAEPTFWQDHLHPDDRKWAVDFRAARTREKRSHDFEYRMISADERIVWLRDMVTVIVENDQPVKLRGVMVDITEHKRAEDEIRRLKEFNENLINSMSEGIAVQDIDGYFTFVNPAAAVITGYTPEEFVGEDWKKFFPADQHQRIKEADNRRLAGETSRYEVDFLHKSGKRINMLVSGSPLFEKERFNGSMAVFTDITERKQAEKKIRRQIDYLTALQDIDRTIASAFDMRLSLNALISKAISLLAVDAAAVLLINFSMNSLEFAAGQGFRTNAVKTASVKLGESYAGRAALEQRIVKIPNLKDEPGNLFLTGLLKGEDFVSYYGVPLVVKGKVIGVLEVFQRSLIKRDQEWLDFLNALAAQAAIAISNAQLFDNLQHSNSELIRAYDATIEGWSRAMDLRDKETEGHTLRVTEMTLRLAGLMHINAAKQVHIRRGALLHDIGKLGVPDGILFKPDKLTDDEWVIMRQHPTHAYEMLSSIEYLKPALDIPYCHHEKWDGTGYPRGLKGEQIPLVARIFAVVDVWDALRSDRPYRSGWPEEKVLDYIRAEAGKYFDPEVVKAFLSLTADK